MQGNAKLLPRDYVGVTPPSDPGAAPDAKRGLSESSAERPARRLFKTSGRTNRYIPWVHISAVLFAIDVVAALAAGLLARAQIAGIFAVPHLSTSLVTTVAPLACCRVFYVRGLYTPSKLVRPGRFSAIAFASVEVGAILIATASIGMLLSPGKSTVWLGGGSAYAMAVPPSILVGIVCSVVLMATRWSCCLIWQFLSRLNFSCNRVLLAGEPAERVIAQLAATDCASMEVTGVLSNSPHDGSHIGLKKYRSWASSTTSPKSSARRWWIHLLSYCPGPRKATSPTSWRAPFSCPWTFTFCLTKRQGYSWPAAKRPRLLFKTRWSCEELHCPAVRPCSSGLRISCSHRHCSWPLRP